MTINQILLLLINEKLYQNGQIDKSTKEKIDMEIKTNMGKVDLL